MITMKHLNGIICTYESPSVTYDCP